LKRKIYPEAGDDDKNSGVPDHTDEENTGIAIVSQFGNPIVVKEDTNRNSDDKAQG